MANEEPKNLYLLPNGLISYCRTSNEDIEYTCTDALIDKACEWLSVHDNYSTPTHVLVEQFKQAMKGGDNE